MHVRGIEANLEEIIRCIDKMNLGMARDYAVRLLKAVGNDGITDGVTIDTSRYAELSRHEQAWLALLEKQGGK